ncbi:MAG TPA: serine hydrolase [Candidatus Saccharimonadia bacterium]|nr:serine hydrolase [Candidatus Saccharimonadia bacterium]
MKTLALIVTLALHVTGVWQNLPATAKASVTAVDTATPVGSLPVRMTAPPALPVQTGNPALSLNASSAYAVDTATGTVLYAQNAADPRAIASITKLVTILVILSTHKTSEEVRIPTLPSYQTTDQTMGLQPGETYQLGDLVRAILIYSADDGADALAIYDAGSTTKFAAKMNTKMAEWGITGAHFSNPSGLTDAGNSASAEAVAKIAELALTNPFIRQTVGQSKAVFTNTAGRQFNLPTTDDLLASGQFYGIKTGYTLNAGECFVGLTRIQGHEVITVVLGAGDRFGATLSLTNWIGLNWQWL